MNRAERTDPRSNPSACVSKYFRFQLENRLRDDQSGQVRYNTEDANALSLQLPDSIISNKEEYNAYKEAVAAAKAAKVWLLV